MKVTINLTVDIDSTAWIQAGGLPNSDITEDVRDYIQDLVQTRLADMEVLTENRPHQTVKETR